MACLVKVTAGESAIVCENLFKPDMLEWCHTSNRAVMELVLGSHGGGESGISVIQFSHLSFIIYHISYIIRIIIIILTVLRHLPFVFQLFFFDKLNKCMMFPKTNN